MTILKEEYHKLIFVVNIDHETL